MNKEATPKKTSSLEQTSPHMPQLDALRAFAVAGVAYHHWIPQKYHYGIPFWAGVPLFFVLSGFLISSILIQCRSGDLWFAMRAFYARRFLRIFPLFYFVILTAYVLNLPPMRETVLWHLSYLSNFYFFFHQGWNGNVSHFWSLAVEEQFYLFWPAIVLFSPARRLLHWFLALCAIGVLSIVLLPLFFPDTKMLAVLPNYNFLALGLGSLLALRKTYPKTLNTLTDCSKYSVVLFAILTAISACGIHFKGITQLSYCTMVVAFFWLIFRASIGFKGWLGKCLTMPILVYLGRISYGLYVLHMFADYPVDVFCRRVIGVSSSSLTFTQILALKFCATILGAIISWHLLEYPINSLKRWFPYRRKRDENNQAT
jgi:peptidoglycan/LPS O-acetylase OafA/YrhL